MHNPPGQEITRMNHVKKEIKVPPWEFLEARLSSVVTLHLATVSNCHGQWNAQQQSFWTVFVCDVRLFPKPGVCRNAKTIDLSGQRCVLKWYCERLKDQILSGCPAEESQYQLHMFMSCHEVSPCTYEQKHPSALFLSAQAGEDLVPEQENEREEAEKRDASVLHSIPPVLMRDGAKRTGCHFKVKHKLCDNSSNNINNTCMCNILKNTLNNSFFFEFMMHISLWF